MAFVPDRLGHDFRYAPDIKKISRELHWKSRRPFDRGLIETIEWYRSNQDWWRSIKSNRAEYQKYYVKQYAKRLSGRT